MILANAADVLLRLSLKPGETHKYTVVRDFRDPAHSDQTQYTEEWTFTVEPGEGPRRKVKVATLLRKSVFDGTTVASTDTVPTRWSEERSADGEVSGREPDLYFPSLRGRQSRVLDVWFGTGPHTVGSTWRLDKPADAETEFPAASWAWTLRSATDQEAVLRLAFAERGEDAVTADGTIRVSRIDGWPIEVDVTVRNTEVPGDSEHARVNLHITWKRL